MEEGGHLHTNVWGEQPCTEGRAAAPLSRTLWEEVLWAPSSTAPHTHCSSTPSPAGRPRAGLLCCTRAPGWRSGTAGAQSVRAVAGPAGFALRRDPAEGWLGHVTQGQDQAACSPRRGVCVPL